MSNDDVLPAASSDDSSFTPLFPLGRLFATPGALTTLELFGISYLSLVFARHACGDYGDLEEEDRLANEAALINGGRIFSAYIISRKNGTATVTDKIWVITEADRASTCVLRPDEY